MANSRKSRSPNKPAEVQGAFERALGEFLARVCVSAPAGALVESIDVGIAFSGGIDSTVLLHLAHRYRAAPGTPTVRWHAFHIHHGLSPNADAWEAHCAVVAAACGMPYASREVAVPRDGGEGIEQAARIARYAALGDLCRASGVGLLLTAHHQDDQAETVILQMLRGAGLPGLSGMASYQPEHALLGPAVAVGRPLLGIARAALEQVLAEAKLPHVQDESNCDTVYRRNALRHVIAPALETHFPGFSALLSRSATHAQTAMTLLQDLAEIDLAACRPDHPGDSNAAAAPDALAIPRLQQLSSQRFDNLLRHWLHRHGVQLPSTARLEEIRAQMLGAESDMHPFFDFDNVTLHRIAGRLELHPKLGAPPTDAIVLRWAGEHEILVPAWRGRMIFEETDGPALQREAVLRGPLVLQPRVGQERLKLALNRPSRPLKSLFQEVDVASWRRKWSPLVYLDADLVFVAELGMEVRQLRAGSGVVLRWRADHAESAPVPKLG